MKDKAELLLHPVRMKIIQALLGGRQLTVQHIAERLPDVPQATLYRHLNLLYKGGLLVITKENQIRGAVERVYALAENAANLTDEDVQNASPQEHMEYFLHFVAGLIGDFGSYLEGSPLNLRKDGVAYRQAAFYATEEELQQLIQALSGPILKAMEKEPAPGRRKRTLTTILLPDKQ